MLSTEDFTPQNSEFLIRRGWRIWSKDELICEKTLLLCPVKDFENVPDGTVLTSIFGEQKVKGTDDIDQDSRAGLLAYGVLLEKINIPDPNKKYRTLDELCEPEKVEPV